MATVINAWNYLAANYQVILAAVTALISGLIAVAMLIPGEQPEKALKAVVAFIEKFSKK